MAELADYLHLAPEPVPSLARLLSRRPSSVLAKMANLDGSRSHGGPWDVLAGVFLRDDPTAFADLYRVILGAARGEGIGPDRPPDFLGLEGGGELTLLGQDELQTSIMEASLREQIARDARRTTSHSIPACSPSTAACASTWPGRLPRPPASIPRPASTSGARRYGNACCCPTAHTRRRAPAGAQVSGLAPGTHIFAR